MEFPLRGLEESNVKQGLGQTREEGVVPQRAECSRKPHVVSCPSRDSQRAYGLGYTDCPHGCTRRQIYFIVHS